LPDDVAAARADGFAHAISARALRDGHEHDSSRDPPTRSPMELMTEIKKRHGRGDLTKLVGDLLRAGYSKLSGLL